MEGIDVGDEVFDENGAVCRVLAVYDVKPESAYRVSFSDGSMIEACGDHQWVTLNRHERRSGRLNGDWASGAPVRATTDIERTLTIGKRMDANHCIPVCKPLQLPEAQLSVHPYVLGAWLGDGTSREAIITVADEEIIDRIRACGETAYRTKAIGAPQYAIGVAERKRGPDGRMASSGGLHARLKALGILGKKYVPSEYMRASAGQRLELLRGLMDTDGYAYDHGTVEFTSTNRYLARDVRELTHSLGQKPVMKAARATLDGRDCGPKWRVTWRPTIEVFTLERKLKRTLPLDGPQSDRHHHRMIVSIEPIEPKPMRCITVDSPNSMYLAGQAMIPTHNTWAGAHILAEWILADPEPGEWGIVAPTFEDGWATCVEGPSGILAALGTTTGDIKQRKSPLIAYWNRSWGELRFRNGHLIRVASADDGGLRIQGKNLKGAWADEIGLWDKWQTAWMESLGYAVRLGKSQIVVTGTPKASRKAKALVKMLLDDPNVPVRRLRTVDNSDNLSPAFFQEVVGRAKGTRLERQELEGELLEDVEGALWTTEVIDANRIEFKDMPDLDRIVIAIDPAVSANENSDESGIVVVGEKDGHGYVIADYSRIATPNAVMHRVVQAFYDHKADCIVGEVNNGGDYIGTLLRTVDANVPYKVVHATRGKALRAEPVSALYEQNRVHHVGLLTELEDQMVTWAPGSPGSPDRLDAMVYAITELHSLSTGDWLTAYGVYECHKCQHKYMGEVNERCPKCGAEKM